MAAFCVPANELPGSTTDDHSESLVIVAERAAGTVRADPAPAIASIRTAVAARHDLDVADVLLLAAGAISRTTSGKLARRACRAQYLAGELNGR